MNESLTSKLQEVYLCGSDAITRGEFELAVQWFDRVANYLEDYEYMETIDTIFKILSNRGFCHFKLRNDYASIEDFSNLLDRIEIYRYLASIGTALTTERNSQWENLVAKSLMRRAVCFENIGEFHKAVKDLSELQRNHSEVVRQNATVQTQWNRLSHHIKQDCSAAKEDGRPAWMAHANQALRLSLIRSLPRKLRLQQPFTCRVALGNELGLFDRSVFISPLSESNGSENVNHDLGAVICEVLALDENQIPYIAPMRLLCSTTQTNCVKIGEDGKAKLHAMFVDNSNITSGGPANIDILLRFSVIHRTPAQQNLRFDVTAMDVLPVISIPITLNLRHVDESLIVDPQSSRNSMANLKDLFLSMQVNCLRPIALPEIKNEVTEHHNKESGKEILCGESVGLLGIGGKIWDSTFVLIQYLEHNRAELVTNRKLLELGAGTGITSLALSRLSPAMVLCTDLAEVVPLISVNMQINAARSQDLREVLLERYHVEALTWGEEISSLANQCEVIIASDVVYYPEGYEPLIKSLEQLLSNTENVETKKRCILAHRHRHPEDHRFFSMLESSALLSTEELLWKSSFHDENSLEVERRSTVLRDVRMFCITAR